MTQKIRWSVGIIMMALIVTMRAEAQTPAIAVVPQAAAKVSKFEAVASRTGVLLRREAIPLQSARAEGVEANVIRLEDVGAHEVVFSLQVTLPEKAGVAIVSEEEMADLKDSVAYMLQNVAGLADYKNPVAVAYKTISGAAFGYAVHHLNAAGQELPPTAYVEIPVNPYIADSGGFERVRVQLLQKMVAEAQGIIDDLQVKK